MAYHRFAWNKFDDTGITGLHEFGVVLQGLATPTIDLLNELSASGLLSYESGPAPSQPPRGSTDQE